MDPLLASLCRAERSVGSEAINKVEIKKRLRVLGASKVFN